MSQARRVVATFFLALNLAACVGTSALESQSRQKDARFARMYFLREKGILGAVGGRTPAAEIKVDGKAVGAVTNGSYIFVDRPAGSYKLSVQAGISMASEADVRLDAGRDYYFNIGVPRSAAPGTALLNQAYAGGRGEPVGGHSGFSAAALYSLDPSIGAAEIAQLKAP
ncbi:MAG: DUF2846 domain-containing protein [Afipia sp.]